MKEDGPHLSILDEDPSSGTVGPLIGTVLVISILIFGAWLAWGRLVDRIQVKRASDEAVSSALSGVVSSTTEINKISDKEN